MGGKEKFFVNDNYTFDKQYLEGLKNSNNLKLSNDSTTISVLSAGWNSGATCVIAKDGQNLLSNSFFAGMGIVVFDPITVEVDTSFWLTIVWINQQMFNI